ncbi:MAG: helix-turn-helix domain-containing protein [Saccharofermentanales bacterium]
MFEDLLPELEKSIESSTGSIPVVFKGIERQFAKGDITQKYNRHEFHELLYIRNGKARFNIEGNLVQVGKGDILIIRPNQTHKIIVNEGNADMIVLYFGFKTAASHNPDDYPDLYDDSTMKTLPEVSKLTIENFIQFANGSDPSPAHNEKMDPYLMIKGKSRQDIAGIAERILKESKSDAYGKELMMQFLAMELLISLSRGLREEWEESIRVKTGKAKELVRIAANFLAEHHDHNISITDAAAYVFLSQGYFTRAFRDETGMSPMSFLIQVRINHACRLLEQNDTKVSGIAHQVGFASPQRFNAAFRKQMGLTPMEYRNKMIKY